MSQPGGPLQQQAWRAMRLIRADGIDAYAGLARRAGRPRTARVAGTVCSTNLLAPFIPCHRVVASNGRGGYGYRLDIKVTLLEHAGVLLSREGRAQSSLGGPGSTGLPGRNAPTLIS